MKKPYIGEEGEVRELDADFFERARRGRPALPEEAKKRRVNLMLDPDVVERLQATPNISAFVNSLLREKLGL
jgi:uncharacterized protein (DUF4415 family)